MTQQPLGYKQHFFFFLAAAAAHKTGTAAEGERWWNIAGRQGATVATLTCPCLAGLGAQGCLRCCFSICPVQPQNPSAHRGHAPHFALFLFSLLLLFPSSSLCTWLISSLSQGAPQVIPAGTGPLKTKADFCRSHPCLGLSLQEGTFLLFLALPLLLAWLGCCPLGRAEAGFGGGWRVGRWLWEAAWEESWPCCCFSEGRSHFAQT